MPSSLLHCLNKRAQVLGSPNEWDWVLSDLIVGCFTPALHLMESEAEIQLSSRTRRRSRELYLGNIASFIQREHRLRPLLDKLKENDIEVIPLKGAALLDTLYKKIGLRWMGDIDLLVKGDDYLDAAQILLEEGLALHASNSDGDDYKFKELPKDLWPGELSFQGKNELNIDLHRSFVTYHWFQSPFPVDMTVVWSRAVLSEESSSDGDEPLWKTFLSPYDMLAHMCLHLALHGIQIMKNLWDVDLFLRELPENWDWNLFISVAEMWGLKSACYHVFLFCQEIFDTPLPNDVLIDLSPGPFDRWQVKQLISPEALLSDRPTLGKRYPTLVKFALFENSKVKWAAIRHLIFPDRALLENNPQRRTIIDHWRHILDVFLRGD